MSGVADRDLAPLAEIRTLRKVQLGALEDAGLRASADRLRASRPDLEVDYVCAPRAARRAGLQVGLVTIHPPSQGALQWSIRESLAERLEMSTNYAVEARLKRELKTRDAALLKRLEWDSEAGAVGVYADTASDVRAVADVINETLAAAGKA